MDFQDWYFENIKELIRYVDSEENNLDHISIGDIDKELFIKLKTGSIKPQFGNKEHIKIVKLDRLNYLREKYNEYWFNKPNEEILGHSFTDVPTWLGISYEELIDYDDLDE